MKKTDQTVKVLLEQCEKIGYGEFLVKLIVHNKELVGFEQESPPLIKFRAGKEKRKDGEGD